MYIIFAIALLIGSNFDTAMARKESLQNYGHNVCLTSNDCPLIRPLCARYMCNDVSSTTLRGLGDLVHNKFNNVTVFRTCRSNAECNIAPETGTCVRDAICLDSNNFYSQAKFGEFLDKEVFTHCISSLDCPDSYYCNKSFNKCYPHV